MTEQDHPRPRPARDPIPEEVRAHVEAAREEMRRSVESMFPPGFLEHRRAARKEMLLAARSLIDAAIKRLEAREKRSA